MFISKRLIALASSIGLIIGTFSPILSIPVLGNMNFYKHDETLASLTLIMAIASIIIILLNKNYKWLLVTGSITCTLLLIDFIFIQSRLDEVKHSMSNELNDNPFKGLADLAVNSIQFEWGWSLLLISALLLTVSYFIKENESSGDSVNLTHDFEKELNTLKQVILEVVNIFSKYIPIIFKVIKKVFQHMIDYLVRMTRQLKGLLFQHKIKILSLIIISLLSLSIWSIRDLEFAVNLREHMQLPESKFYKDLHNTFTASAPQNDDFDSEPKNLLLRLFYNQGIKAYKSNKYQEAKILLFIPAIYGNAESQYLLGFIYANGLGCDRSLAKFERYLTLASNQNHSPSQFTLSYFYNVISKANLSQPKVKDHFLEKRNDLLKKSAENNYSKAQFALGVFYEDGSLGSVDLQEAARWYKSSAEQGNEKAQKEYDRLTAYFQAVNQANEKMRQIDLQNQQYIQASIAQDRVNTQKRAKRNELMKDAASVLFGVGLGIGAGLAR